MAVSDMGKRVFACDVRPLGVALGMAWALWGCGDGAAAPAAAADVAEPGAEASAGPGELSFSVEGRGSSTSTSGVMLVWEGEPNVELSLRGVDAADNLVLFYVTFDGVDSVVGPHTFEIGMPAATSASGIGVMDDQIFYSLRGELALDMSGDGRADGRFDMELALDDGSGPPAGVPSEQIESALSLSGTFRSEWTLDCRTRIVGFSSGHYTHESPYCQSLTF